MKMPLGWWKEVAMLVAILLATAWVILRGRMV